MQLFIPTLITIVIAAVLAFIVIPRTGALILASVSLLALIAAGIHHYNLFYSEYMLSTWQNGIGANASFIILGLAIVFIIGSVFYMFTGTGTSVAANIGSINSVQEALAAPLNAMSQSMEQVMNTKPSVENTGGITGAFNKGLDAITNVANVVTNNVNTVVNNALNGAKANASKFSPIIPGTNFRASEI